MEKKVIEADKKRRLRRVVLKGVVPIAQVRANVAGKLFAMGILHADCPAVQAAMKTMQEEIRKHDRRCRLSHTINISAGYLKKRKG